MKNVVVHGISKADVKGVRSKANDKNFYLEFDVIFPRLELLADYKGNAVLGELTVKSGGRINITASTFFLLNNPIFFNVLTH